MQIEIQLARGPPLYIDTTSLSYPTQYLLVSWLLVASAVRTAWAQFNYATGNRLSCASDLPLAALVPFGKPTKYLCSDGSQLESVQLNRAGFGSSRSPGLWSGRRGSGSP